MTRSIRMHAHRSGALCLSLMLSVLAGCDDDEGGGGGGAVPDVINTPGQLTYWLSEAEGFGCIPANHSSYAVLNFQNGGFGTLNITSITSALPQLTITPTSLVLDEFLEKAGAIVTAVCPTPGEFSGEIVVTSDDPNALVVQIPVRITCNQYPPFGECCSLASEEEQQACLAGACPTACPSRFCPPCADIVPPAYTTEQYLECLAAC